MPDYLSDVDVGFGAAPSLLSDSDVGFKAAKPAVAPPPSKDGFFATAGKAAVRGAIESTKAVAQAPTAFSDRVPEESQNDELGHLLSQDVTEGWRNPNWWAANISHGIASSYPSVALGIGGGMLGTAAGVAAVGGPEDPAAVVSGPVGGLAGGAGGFALGSALTAIAPAYKRAIAQGLTHDQAVDRAMKETGIAAASGAMMGLAPEFKLFGTTAEGALKKPISEALAQVFGVQPAIGAAQQEATGAVEGKTPTLPELATGYASNVGVGVAAVGAHAAVAKLAASAPTKIADDVMNSGTVDDAIDTATANINANLTSVAGQVADVSRETSQMSDDVRANQQTKLNNLFTKAGEGSISQDADGNYFYKTGTGDDTNTIPLKVWDENAPPEEQGTASISPDLAAAQRQHYGQMGVDVVYFQNDPSIKFDGATDRSDPAAIFLSNDPTRNAAQVGAHEITHVLEATTLPDGTSLGDLLKSQVLDGLTSEGWQYANKRFGAGAPDRAQFQAGPEGDAAHADAIVNHLVTEVGADIGGEAPKFAGFFDDVANKVEQNYGADVAKDVFQKFLAGIRNAMQTIRSFFGPDSPGAENTVSQHWVTNLADIHDTLAKMYAERYGSQLQKEQSLVGGMSDQNARNAFLRAPEPVTEGAPPETAPILDQAAPAEVTAPRAFAADTVPEAQTFEQLRDQAVRYRRWLRDLDDNRRTAASTSAKAQELHAQVGSILGRVNGIEERLTGAQRDRLANARSQLDNLLNPKSDNRDMVKVRTALLDVRDRMADLAPKLSIPYREALARGEEPPPSRPEMRQGDVAFSPKSEDVSAVGDEIKDRFGLKSLHISKSGNDIVVSNFVVPAEARGRGIGTDAMREIMSYADAHGLRVTLSPGKTGDLGGEVSSPGRAKRFYKALGFVENAGRNKDFSTRETMLREPQRYIEDGKTLDPLAIYADGKEDGRHRAVAAKELGINQVPSIDFRKNVNFSPRTDQTETPEFRNWFGSSRVVDGTGKPLVVYHGTNQDIKSFDTERLGANTGSVSSKAFFFTENPKEADEYAAMSARKQVSNAPEREANSERLLKAMNRALARNDHNLYEKLTLELEASEEEAMTGEERGANIVPVYLKINNPLVIDMKGGSDLHVISDAIKAAKKTGHDGLRLDNVFDPVANRAEQFDTTQWIAFKPEQIKSAIGNSGAFDQNDPRISFSPRDEEQKPFFSGLTRAVENMKQEKAPPGQWLAAIRNAGGVKEEELKWTGVGEWLNSHAKSVTKVELLDYIRSNEVKVSEVLHTRMDDEQASEQARSNPDTMVEMLIEKGRYSEPVARQFVDALASGKSAEQLGISGLIKDRTKFGQYTLPGGKNYRELLLTLPKKDVTTGEVAKKLFGKEMGFLDENERQQVVKEMYRLNDSNAPFRSSHWDEPNVLAHVRFDDRVGPNGEKVLHVAEVQSDWMQKGRKEGFDVPGLGEEFAIYSNGRRIAEDMTKEQAEARLAQYKRTEPNGYFTMDVTGYPRRGAVPNAPFKTTWPELAMKRMIRYAAEHGYARVSWDTGDTNAERYNLSKQVDSIKVRSSANEGNVIIDITPTSGGKISMEVNASGNVVATPNHSADQFVGKPLSDVVGKEMADKIITDRDEGSKLWGVKNRESGNWSQRFATKTEAEAYQLGLPEAVRSKTDVSEMTRRFGKDYSGLDLKIGGEGMKAFYDNQLPLVANKLGKKFGARTEDIKIKTDNAPADAHSIEITPAMRESVMRGQPMFSPRIVGEEHNDRQYTQKVLDAFDNVGFRTNPPTLSQRLATFRQDLGKKTIQWTLDQFNPIKEVSPTGYLYARLSKGSAGTFEALLKFGKIKIRNGVFDADKTGGFIDTVGKPLHGEIHDFLRWVAGHRAEQLSLENRENLFSASDIKALKSLSDGQTKFDYTLSNGMVTRDRLAIYRDSLTKYDAFNRNVMDMAAQSGLVDSATRHIWERTMYVPFYRMADSEGQFAGPKFGDKLIRQAAFKSLKGGIEKLNDDILDNVLQNWYHLLDAAGKNRAATDVVKAASLGLNPPVFQGTEQAVRAMAKAMGLKDNVAWIMDGGQQKFFLIKDKMLFQAISAIENSSFNFPLMKAFRFFKVAQTLGVTSSPFFKVKNLIRDSIQSIATAPISYNIAKNIKEGAAAVDASGALKNFARTAIGLNAADRNFSQAYVSMLASGGLVRFGSMLDGNMAVHVDHLIHEGVHDSTILNSHNKVKALYSKIKSFAEAYAELGNTSEEINRAALYNQLIAKGVGHAEASLAARDLMDFSMQGTLPAVRFLTQVVPFMNARIQGLYKLGRATNEDKRRVIMVLTAVSLFSIGLMANNINDPDYQKLPDSDRNNNWWFKIGGQAYRIPKPFEIGALATLTERGAETFFNPEMTGRQFANNVWQLMGDNLSMNPIPQAIHPLLAVYSNADSFTGNPIESIGQHELLPEDRYTSRSTLAARGVSEAGNVLARAMVGNQQAFLSPVQIDYLVRGYFGWLGSFITGGVDSMLRPLSGLPTQPTGDGWRTATGGLISSLPEPSSRYVDQMYQQGKVLDEAYASFKAKLAQGDEAGAQQFLEDNQDKLAQRGQFGGVRRLEGVLNKQARQIENDRTMTADQKRTAIQELNAARNDAARQLYRPQ